MRSRYGIVLGWLILVVFCVCLTDQEPLVAQSKKSLKARLKSAFKDKQAWTLDEAMAQLNVYPKDAYLQYVALQLARREQRADEIGAQIANLIGDEVRQQRRERVNQADLFSIFTGALAVQESLQLDSMRGDRGGRVPAGNRMPRPGGPPSDMRKAPSDQKGTPKGEPVLPPPSATAKESPQAPRDEKSGVPFRAERDPGAVRRKEQVKVADLSGPTIKSHPWEEMLAGKKPEISPLARYVPEDFYFAEFRSLNKLLEAMDATDLWGRHLFNQATQEARTNLVGERLKTQLVVETNRLLRPVYDLVVEEVAVAGSDLFLAEGSDVTLLFRYKQAEVFKARMDGFLANVQKSRADVTRRQSEHLGIEYIHLQTPDRAVHVYSAYPAPGLHVRSNSQVAFKRILEVIQGKTANGAPARSLGDTKEFAYIRTLMPRGAKEEDGFIYLSDPFIRRLVGPQVKLTERRRMLCYNHVRMIGHAAMLYRTEYGRAPQSLEELAKSQCAPGLFGKGELSCPDGGAYSLSADGMTGVCSHHGHAHSLTPCCEIPVRQVDGEEADEYKEFLQEYNQYWRAFFDPIALRIQLTAKRYRLETIVLPLIDNSIYTGLAHVLGGNAEPLDALPVPKRNIFSVALRLNKEDLLAEAGLILPQEVARPERRPGNRRHIPTAADIKGANNLRAIGLALHNYHDSYGRFPAAANFDKEGKPLLSWRVHLLPFLDEDKLYAEFHLNEPWDSAHNSKLISRLPAVYRTPDQKLEAGKTTYLAPVYQSAQAEGTMFTGRAQRLGMADVTDGLSNTIFVADVDDEHAVTWTRPEDLKYDPKNPKMSLRRRQETYLTLFVDGSVHFLPETVDPQTLHYLFIRNDNHQVVLPDEEMRVQTPRQPGARFWGLPLDVGQLKLEELLSKGLGNQVGLHVYDAAPFFDFNLPGFFGMMMGSFNGRQQMFFGRDSEQMMIAVLIASLNAPVYLSFPVQDARVVDEFLTRLDKQLVHWSRRRERGGFISIEQDFYHLPLDKEHAARAYGFRFGPVKWRFFWARIGKGLYVASKPAILENLLGLEGRAADGNRAVPTDEGRGPQGHAMIRIRAQHWDQVLPDYRLAWAENNREACLHNLGPLSSSARALRAKSSGQTPDERARSMHRLADRTHGVHSFCPEGGRYELASDGKEVTCTVHGSARAPRQAAAPAENSPSSKLLHDLTGMTATLTFLEDGLHAVVVIDRK